MMMRETEPIEKKNKSQETNNFRRCLDDQTNLNRTAVWNTCLKGKKKGREVTLSESARGITTPFVSSRTPVTCIHKSCLCGTKICRPRHGLPWRSFSHFVNQKKKSTEGTSRITNIYIFMRRKKHTPIKAHIDNKNLSTDSMYPKYAKWYDDQIKVWKKKKERGAGGQENRYSYTNPKQQ